jgi:peptide/nickel transport system substrate-binding protein
MRLGSFALALTVLLASPSVPIAAASDSGTLRIALSTSPNSLNPLLRTQLIESLITRLVFDPMVLATPDGTIRPMLAATVPTLANGGISRDGLTYTYHLRRGIRWHDGTPFTSRDVAFTQRAAVDPKNNVTLRDPYDFVTRIDTPADDVVVVHLKTPYAPFVAEWFGNAGDGILPAHLLAASPELNDVPFDAAPVGTGPFVFDRWERGREITFHANASYRLGKPHLEHVIVQLMADENSRNVALRTGETDWSFAAGALAARQFADGGNVTPELLAANAYFGIVTNTRRPPLDDVRVRRALAFALDRPSMVAKISGTFAVPASSDLPPDDWAYDPSVRALPYDPARSRALLASAGFKPGTNGTLERDGKPLSLTLVYAAGSPVPEAYGLQIQALLRAVGVDVQLKPTQANILFAPAAEGGITASGHFDLGMFSFYNSADPNDRRSFSCGAIPPNGFNDSRWCDAAYDGATNDALLHVDRTTRKHDYRMASERLIDEAPWIFVYWPKDVELVRRGVKIDDGSRNIAAPYLWSIDDK